MTPELPVLTEPRMTGASRTRGSAVASGDVNKATVTATCPAGETAVGGRISSQQPGARDLLHWSADRVQIIGRFADRDGRGCGQRHCLRGLRELIQEEHE